MINTQYLKISNLVLDKSENCDIIKLYKQSVKQVSRLSARTISIFLDNKILSAVYKITTIYRNYLLLGVYSQKVFARYKTPIFSRSL